MCDGLGALEILNPEPVLNSEPAVAPDSALRGLKSIQSLNCKTPLELLNEPIVA